MNIHLRKPRCLSLVLILALLLGGCAPLGIKRVQPEPVTVKVANIPFLSFGPYFIGAQEGYFNEQGIEVEFVEMRKSSEAYPLLAQGELDVTSGFGIGYLNAIARGARIRVVACKGYLAAPGCTYNPFIARRALVEAGELDSPAQLKGRTISFEPGTMHEYFIDVLLSTANLTLNDIQGVEIPKPSEIEALGSGAIDFTSTAEPWVTRIVQSGNGVVWKPVKELLPDFQIATVLYGPNLLDENPDVGRRFMVGYLQAVRQYNEGKTERNLELMAEFTGLDKEFLKQACWPSFHGDGQINVESVLDFQDWAMEKGYLDSVVTEEQFWDPSFVNYASEVLGTSSQ
jgi:NitT/TauT family transport system substrate-binding protein